MHFHIACDILDMPSFPYMASLLPLHLLLSLLLLLHVECAAAEFVAGVDAIAL